MVFKRVFGTPSSNQPAIATAAMALAGSQDAPADVHDTLDILEKREAHLERLVAREIEQAREYAAGNNKKAALECMKRKRLYETQLEKIPGQKLNLIQQEQMLQALKINSIVVASSASSAVAIEREIKKVGNAEGVDAVQDRLDDALADAADVLGAASRPMGEAASLDDAELLDELEQMELQEELLGVLPAHQPTAAQPHEPVVAQRVPKHVPDTAASSSTPKSAGKARATAAASRRAEEERDEALLQEWMSSMKLEQPMPMPMSVERAVPMHMKLEQAMPMPMMAACY